MKTSGRPQYYRLRRIVEMVREGNAHGYRPNTTDFRSELAVSRRTVARDLDFLRDDENAPLAYDPASHGYHLTEATYNLPPVRLREEEIYSFFVARKLLEGFAGTPLATGLESVLEKIGEQLQGYMSVDPAALTDQFTVLAEDRARIDPGLWAAAARTINGRQRVRAVYQRFDGVVGRYELEPLHLALYHGNWYLLARKEGGGSVEIFALSRFREFTATNDRFEPPADFRPADYLRQGFGISRSAEPIRARLLFSRQVATYIKERVWHPSQEIRERPDGQVELRIEVVGRKELTRWILSWVPEVIVLAPRSLRQLIRTRLKQGLTGQSTERPWPTGGVGKQARRVPG